MREEFHILEPTVCDSMQTMNKKIQALLLSFKRSILFGIAILFVLAACGGGSDGSGSGSGDDEEAVGPDFIELAHYDPLGAQIVPEDNPLAPAAVGAGVTASELENITHGFLSGANFDLRPVLMGVGVLDVDNSFYLSFTITPNDPALGVFIDSITYTYTSYSPLATGTISLRTSADGFATTVDSKAWIGNIVSRVDGFVALTFDASSIVVVQGPLEVRLYMHDLVGGDTFFGKGFPNPVDWADLKSTADNGDGLRVLGRVISPGS